MLADCHGVTSIVQFQNTLEAEWSNGVDGKSERTSRRAKNQPANLRRSAEGSSTPFLGLSSSAEVITKSKICVTANTKSSNVIIKCMIKLQTKWKSYHSNAVRKEKSSQP